MSSMRSPSRPEPSKDWQSTGPVIVLVAGLAILALLAFAAAFLSQTAIGDAGASLLRWVFATDTQQVWWYITRSAGIISYLLLWLSTLWGLALTNKIGDWLIQRGFTFEFHQTISLLSLGFLTVHILVLMLDKYLPFSPVQLLVPFTASYRPLWTGIGIFSLYLTLLVTVTFYLRKRIGLRLFRLIHVLSLLAFVGGALHGLFAGTDSPLPAMQLMYAGTFLAFLFMFFYWLITLTQTKASRPQTANVRR